MNFDNLFQNSGSKPTTTTTQTNQSSSPLSGIEQSPIQDGESILEKAAVCVLAGAIF